MNDTLTPIIWLGDSRDTVRSWPIKAKRRAGEELFRLQLGSEPIHWRTMSSVGRAVREVKVSEGGQFRIFYLVRRKESIVVLHAFEKKSQRTSNADIELGKQRLKLI